MPALKGNKKASKGRKEAHRPSLFLLGVDHTNTPLSLREECAFSAADAAKVARYLTDSGRFEEAVVLSTCNRTEVYVVPSEEQPTAQYLRSFMSEIRKTEIFLDSSHARRRDGISAAEHLFRVAAGLESQMIGESEILGQVRSALRRASQAGTVKKVLKTLFESALKVGKRVRANTDLGIGHASFGSAALEIAERSLGSLASRTVLLIGTGKMGSSVARSIAGRGVGRIYIASHSVERAHKLAGLCSGVVLGYEELPTKLSEVDCLISSTNSSASVLSASHFDTAALSARRAPLVCIDLGVPRNIDPAVSSLPKTCLYDIEDLDEVVDDALRSRREEIPKAEAIVSRHLDLFGQWYERLGSVPAEKLLWERFEAARREIVGKVESELDDRERERLEAVTSRLIKKLLYLPLDYLRRHNADSAVRQAQEEALYKLFDLGELEGE